MPYIKYAQVTFQSMLITCEMYFQPSRNLVENVKGDLLADSYCILNRWKNFFSQLLTIHVLVVKSHRNTRS
jgi:hypothetical protein